MSKPKNAETKEVGGRHQERFPEDQRERLEYFPDDRPVDGDEQIRICSPNSPGAVIHRKPTEPRDSTAGKILERLEKLEVQTLNYVHAHQARLKARLSESEQVESEFLEESNQIRNDIFHLVTAQQSQQGNESN
ncbi:hypothetical protein PN509_18190 [Nodularia spumigena CS-588/02]|uniref:hypothetical protein n=1 Tax=Nodularia spumigena TaxID=70799 RepID=UPI0023306944|nr:hypothetical protein [Nodularia spumigena]MDB9362218.1 hypothetical protein [Nodularia spumigena CS-588/02]MDB9367187.1 hypothetical protein [Nodularia spumigena CS-588/02A10]